MSYKNIQAQQAYYAQMARMNAINRQNATITRSTGCGCNKNVVTPMSNPCGCTPPAPQKPVLCCNQTPTQAECPPPTQCLDYQVNKCDSFTYKATASKKCINLCGEAVNAYIMVYKAKIAEDAGIEIDVEEDITVTEKEYVNGHLVSKKKDKETAGTTVKKILKPLPTEEEIIKSAFQYISITEAGETKITPLDMSFIQQMTQETFGHKIQVRGKIAAGNWVKVEYVLPFNLGSCGKTAHSYCCLMSDYGYQPSGCNATFNIEYADRLDSIDEAKMCLYAFIPMRAPKYHVEWHKSAKVNLETGCYTPIKLEKQGKIRDLYIRTNDSFDDGIKDENGGTIAEFKITNNCNILGTKNDHFDIIDLFQNTELGETGKNIHFICGESFGCMLDGGCDTEVDIKTFEQDAQAEIYYSIIRA